MCPVGTRRRVPGRVGVEVEDGVARRAAVDDQSLLVAEAGDAAEQALPLREPSAGLFSPRVCTIRGRGPQPLEVVGLSHARLDVHATHVAGRSATPWGRLGRGPSRRRPAFGCSDQEVVAASGVRRGPRSEISAGTASAPSTFASAARAASSTSPLVRRSASSRNTFLRPQVRRSPSATKLRPLCRAMSGSTAVARGVASACTRSSARLPRVPLREEQRGRVAGRGPQLRPVPRAAPEVEELCEALGRRGQVAGPGLRGGQAHPGNAGHEVGPHAAGLLDRRDVAPEWPRPGRRRREALPRT